MSKQNKSLGWISPEGVFHNCCYGGHISLAQDICIYILDEDFAFANKKLLKLGWVEVQSSYVLFDFLNNGNIRFLTAKQIEILQTLRANPCFIDSQKQSDAIDYLLQQNENFKSGSILDLKIPNVYKIGAMGICLKVTSDTNNRISEYEEKLAKYQAEYTGDLVRLEKELKISVDHCDYVVDAVINKRW